MDKAYQLDPIYTPKEEIAFKRKDDVPSIDYLKEKREIYLNIAKDLKMNILDGSLPKDEVREKLKKKVLEMIK